MARKRRATTMMTATITTTTTAVSIQLQPPSMKCFNITIVIRSLAKRQNDALSSLDMLLVHVACEHSLSICAESFVCALIFFLRFFSMIRGCQDTERTSAAAAAAAGKNASWFIYETQNQICNICNNWAHQQRREQARDTKIDRCRQGTHTPTRGQNADTEESGKKTDYSATDVHAYAVNERQSHGGNKK